MGLRRLRVVNLAVRADSRHGKSDPELLRMGAVGRGGRSGQGLDKPCTGYRSPGVSRSGASADSDEITRRLSLITSASSFASPTVPPRLRHSPERRGVDVGREALDARRRGLDSSYTYPTWEAAGEGLRPGPS
jgi:hypothetical protein